MKAQTLDTKQLAKMAADRVQKSAEFQQRRTTFQADEVDVLEVYILDAYNVLVERGQGLDPLQHAPAQAAQVMIQMAADQWMGRDAMSTEKGVFMLGEWLRTARVAQHRMKYAE